MKRGQGFLFGLILLIGLGCVAVPCLAAVYTVGDTAGWDLGVDYAAWASGKTFSVGDQLVFNHGGNHDVAEVTSSDYTNCTVDGTPYFRDSGNISIVLSSPGNHYFICEVLDHCSSGMRLAVLVAQPPVEVTPPAVITPTTPHISGSVFKVGDTAGWKLGVDYRLWATGKTFRVDDALEFNYDGTLNNLAKVTESGYSACSASGATVSTVGDDTVILATAGMHYFICDIPGHCIGGMKLAISVKGPAPGGGGGSAAAPGSPASFSICIFFLFVHLVFLLV